MSGALSTSPQEDVTPPARFQPVVWQYVPPVFLAAAAAVVSFLGAVLVWPPPRAPLEKLTMAGTVNVVPERDVTLYLGLGAVFLVLVTLLAAVGGRALLRERAQHGASFLPTALTLGVAVGAMVVAVTCFTNASDRLPAGPRVRPLELALLCVIVLACLGGAWAVAPRRPGRPDSMADEAVLREGRRGRWHIADLVVPVLVVGVVYLPGWRSLAGNAFSGEEFLHIDYFAMGPAIAFEKGVALGSVFHPYYGVGWALALTKLPVVRTLSYGHFVRLEVIYGCIYFIGVYGLLRVLTRSWKWATTGTALAILLQVCGSFGAAAFYIWRFPSATVLRWAFDVWFFLACLLYLRTRKEMWLLAGGLLVGLAMTFQTDTGLYLALSAGIFWLCAWRMEPGQVGHNAKRRLIRSGAVAVVLGMFVFGMGLGIASRWTFLSGRFWSGWLENLQFTQSGATLLPLTGVPGRRVLLFFVLMMATYLAVAGYVVFLFVHRRLTVELVLLGTMAVYGFLTLLYFVGRSNPHNLFRPAVPFAIVLAGSGAVIHDHLRRSADVLRPSRSLARPALRAVPWLAMVVALVMLVQHPGFRSYPNLLKTGISGRAPDGQCLDRQPEICGLDPAQAAYGAQLEALADHLRAIKSSTGQVAILDSMGPLLYSMADARPWGRYVPMFSGLFFDSMVETVIDDLMSSPPDIVVMRSRELHNLFLDDIWQALRPSVEQGYVFDKSFGPFEVWQRRVAGAGGERVGSN